MAKSKILSPEDYTALVRARTCRSLAKSLREFGYPGATPENVLTDPLYARASLSNLQEAVDQLKGHHQLREEVQKILDEARVVSERPIT